MSKWYILWFVGVVLIIVVPFQFKEYPLSWVAAAIGTTSAFFINEIKSERIEKFIAYASRLESLLESNEIQFKREII